MRHHRIIIRIGAALLAGATAQAQAAYDFDDIDRWYGQGENQAALVIDWNDGKGPKTGDEDSASLVWGYRWSGSGETGEDLFRKVFSEDPDLFAKVLSNSWGIATLGIGFDANDDGQFSITDGTTVVEFPDGILEADVYEDGDGHTATDADDRYQEGWIDGYWALYADSADGTNTPSNPYDEGQWEFVENVGLSLYTLEDGRWLGLSFGDSYFARTAPSAPVPEPASLGLMAIGTALLIRRRR